MSSLRTFTTAAFMLGASPVIAVPVQWEVSAGGNGHWYEMIFDQPTAVWDVAAASAAAQTYDGMTGYLATITSAAEQMFLNSLNPNNFLMWLGGTDVDTENTWMWVTEPGGPIPFSYTNWAPGEPNNLGNEDYLHGWWTSAGQWNDIYPDWGTAGYVVEYSPAAVPLPASLPLLLAGISVLAFARRRRG